MNMLADKSISPCVKVCRHLFVELAPCNHSIPLNKKVRRRDSCGRPRHHHPPTQHHPSHPPLPSVTPHPLLPPVTPHPPHHRTPSHTFVSAGKLDFCRSSRMTITIVLVFLGTRVILAIENLLGARCLGLAAGYLPGDGTEGAAVSARRVLSFCQLRHAGRHVFAPVIFAFTAAFPPPTS